MAQLSKGKKKSYYSNHSKNAKPEPKKLFFQEEIFKG